MQINEFREREDGLKTHVQKLTVETARKEMEIEKLRRDLETSAEKEQVHTSVKLVVVVSLKLVVVFHLGNW